MSELVIPLPDGSLDLVHGRIVRKGKALKIEPRAWRVLDLLARFRHRVVTKEELLATLWPDGRATQAALRQAVRAARLAIGDEGDETLIRSIPRVGYILNVSCDGAGESATPEAKPDPIPQLLVAPLRNATGWPHLRWIEHGLAACIAHGLSFSARLHVEETRPSDLHLDEGRRRLRTTLRALGARYLIAGSIAQAGEELELTLAIHDEAEETRLKVRAARAAGLVVPAIQALLERLAGTRRLPALAGRLKHSPLLSLELFARALQAAAEQRQAAALRAMELLHLMEPDFPRVELQLLRAQARCGSDAGQATALRLLQAAERDGDAALEAQTRQWLGSLHHVQGRLREAAACLRQALSVGRSCMPASWLGRTLTLTASVECRLGEMHAVQAHLDEAQDILTRIGGHHDMLTVLWLRAIMSALSGNLEQAIQWNRRLVAGARRLRVHSTLVNACLNLAGDLIHADRVDEARRFAEEASGTALAIESAVGLMGTVANVHCLLHRLQGRPDAAAELLAQLPTPAAVQDEGYLWLAHGHAAMAAGRVDAAADCFLRAAAELRRRGNLTGEAPMLPWLVESLVHSGRLDAAQAELDRASAQPHLQHESVTANLLYARALLARRRNRHTEAAALLEQLARAPAALALFRRLGRDLSCAPAEREGPQPRHEPAHGFMRRQFRFANCMLDVQRREFWVQGRQATLAPKPFDVLVYLFRHRDRVVDQAELLDAVWDGASGSPELVAQAIAKIRQALRRGRVDGGLIDTVYGKGYRLRADLADEPDEAAAATLLSHLPATHESFLALVPVAPRGMGAGRVHPDVEYQLELLGHSLAVHARMHRLSPSEVHECADGIDGSVPEAIVQAIRARRPEACVLLAALTRSDGQLSVEYTFVSPQGRTEGTVRGSSPTALGKKLAARLTRTVVSRLPTHPRGAKDAWVTDMLELAAIETEEGRPRRATRILDVVLDHDPENEYAIALRAHMAQTSTS